MVTRTGRYIKPIALMLEAVLDTGTRKYSISTLKLPTPSPPRPFPHYLYSPHSVRAWARLRPCALSAAFVAAVVSLCAATESEMCSFR